MSFGNNIEAMGFEKSGWSLVEVSPDKCTIYKGKTFKEDAKPDEPVWFIMRIKIANGKDGTQTIQTEFSSTNKNKWDDRKNLTYKYL